MRSLVFIGLLAFITNHLTAQKRYESVTAVGKLNITPSEAMKRDALARGAPEKYVTDDQFFDLKKGRVSFGSYIESLYFRIIYTEAGEWIETQELYHCDDDAYYTIFPRLRQAVAGDYYLNDCRYVVKVTQSDGYWYEITGFRAADSLEAIYLLNGNGYLKDLDRIAQTLIFDEEFQFVQERPKKQKQPPLPYQWTEERGKKPIKASANLVRDVLAMGADSQYVRPDQFFLLDNALVSFAASVHDFGFRLIYDADDNWMEKQEYVDRNSALLAQMRRSVEDQYRIADDAIWLKITNMRDYWYEVPALRLADTATLACNAAYTYAVPDTFVRRLVFDKDGQWMGEKPERRRQAVLHESVAEKSEQPYAPSPFLLRDVRERGALPETVHALNFFRCKGGLISFGKSVSRNDLRIVYDAQERWLETQELLHCGVPSDSEYYQLLERFRAQYADTHYICDCSAIVKITNAAGSWYEVRGYPLAHREALQAQERERGYCGKKGLPEEGLILED